MIMLAIYLTNLHIKLDVEFMDERIDAIQIDFFFTLICILVLALVEQTVVSLYDMECLLDSND